MDSNSENSSKMTVTPIRMVTMSSPTVTSVDSPPQTKTITSRISNFSVASLLADTRSKTPPPSRIIANHINRSISNNNNNNNELCLTPKNLSMSQASSYSPNSQHNDSSHSIRHQHDSELLDQRSHTPHSSLASDDYDDSIQGDDDDEDVDIEDVHSENSTNGRQQSSPGLLPPQSMVGGPVPIRPTPFSALAAAWSNMNNGGVGGWPGRQMPPFGPPGLFPGQGFPNGMNGGKKSFSLTIPTS